MYGRRRIELAMPKIHCLFFPSFRVRPSSTKRPHSSLDGGAGSGSGTGSGSGSGSRVPGNLSHTAKRPRAPACAGSTAAPSQTPTIRLWSQPTTAAVSARAAAAAAVHERAVGAAPRGGNNGDGDGVEVVRQVSVDERIAENQRRQGVVDITSDDDDVIVLTPPSLPTPTTSAAGAAAKAAKGGGGGRGRMKGGGISRNLGR